MTDKPLNPYEHGTFLWATWHAERDAVVVRGKDLEQRWLHVDLFGYTKITTDVTAERVSMQDVYATDWRLSARGRRSP